MKFSKTQLKMLSELGKGNNKIFEISKSLKISTSQVYRITNKLRKKGILKERILQPEMKTHVNMLLKLLSKAPNLSNPLSGTGLQIYITLTEPKTIAEIKKETSFHKTTILKKINQGKKMSLILTKKKRYMVNEKIWPDVKDCLTELRKYDESVDPRVPVNSIIYYKNRDEIIFSNKEAIDAEKTAFSAYENYDVGLLLITNYYYLPKKRLTKEKVFRHSLYVIEKAPETKNIIFAILFYAKYKHQLSKIKHPIIKKMNEVLQGRTIPNYPTLAEIKDRADIYNIKI